MESIYPRRVPIMGNLTGNGWTVASQESVLSLIVVLGSSVSLVGLIFAFITYSLFSDLRTMSGTALMYMLANMFLTQLFYVVGVGGVQEDNLCFCLAFGIHYLRLAVISWLCVMTYDMLITFRNNVNINPRPEPVNVLISRFIKYSLFAWGVPSLSVISASIMRATMNHQTVDNLNPYNCWTLLEEVNAVYVIRCPDDRLKDHCNAHIPYAYKFDRVVDWNNDRGLYYGFYEQFRPDEWLHTYPELESMTSIRGVGFGLENVRADLDYYVRPASDGCWATRYPDSYFAAVEQAQDAVGQIALRIMRRNWTVCKDYRRSVARDETAAWAAYERDCTAVGPHVATILWQSQLGRVDPNVGKLSRLAGSGPFTADEQFDAAVRLVDATLGALTTVFDPPDAAVAAAGLAVVDGDYDSFFRQFHRAVKDYADHLPAVAKGVGFSREVLETFRAVVA